MCSLALSFVMIPRDGTCRDIQILSVTIRYSSNGSWVLTLATYLAITNKTKTVLHGGNGLHSQLSGKHGVPYGLARHGTARNPCMRSCRTNVEADDVICQMGDDAIMDSVEPNA